MIMLPWCCDSVARVLCSCCQGVVIMLPGCCDNVAMVL